MISDKNVISWTPVYSWYPGLQSTILHLHFYMISWYHGLQSTWSYIFTSIHDLMISWTSVYLILHFYMISWNPGLQSTWSHIFTSIHDLMISWTPVYLILHLHFYTWSHDILDSSLLDLTSSLLYMISWYPGLQSTWSQIFTSTCYLTPICCKYWKLCVNQGFININVLLRFTCLQLEILRESRYLLPCNYNSSKL